MIDQIKYTRIGITGSRFLTDFSKLKELLSSLPAGTIVSIGDCRGCDKAAADICSDLGLSVQIYSADWQRYGTSAGPIRNKLIIESGIHALFAFPAPYPYNSKGTANCISQARKAGIPVFVL